MAFKNGFGKYRKQQKLHNQKEIGLKIFESEAYLVAIRNDLAKNERRIQDTPLDILFETGVKGATGLLLPPSLHSLRELLESLVDILGFIEKNNLIRLLPLLARVLAQLPGLGIAVSVLSLSYEVQIQREQLLKQSKSQTQLLKGVMITIRELRVELGRLGQNGVFLDIRA